MAGILNWDLGDASTSVDVNSFSHTYTQIGNKTIKVYKGTATGPGDITGIDMFNDNLVGTIDISNLINLNSLLVNGNIKLTKIITPLGSNNIAVFRAADCSLYGVIDVSNLLLSNFDIRSSKGVTQVLNPSNNVVTTGYYVQNCNITGTLNVKDMKGLGGAFWANTNINLTQILHPTSSTNFSSYYVHNSSLNGTLDCSGLLIGGDFQCYNNYNLTKIIHRDCSNNFSNYSAQHCNITGALDISGLTGMGGLFRCDYNPNLTSILMPTPKVGAPLLYYFNVANCSINGTLDMSKTTNLGYSSAASGVFWAGNNINLTQVKNPSTSNYFTSYDVFNCNLTGTFDASNLSNLGGYFRLSGNRNLTKIINPLSSQKFTSYLVNDCSLTGTLDVSALTGLSGQFRVENNTNLQNILLPNNFIHQFSLVNCSSCNLGTSTIDKFYSNLAALWDASTPTQNTNIYTSGGLNSPPTNSSMNADIQKIKTIFDNSTNATLNMELNDGPTQLLHFNGKYYFFNSAYSATSGVDYRISFDCYVDVSSGLLGTWGANVILWIGGNNMGVHFNGDNTTKNGTIHYYYGGNTIRYECPMMSPKQYHHIDFYYNHSASDVSLYIDGNIQPKNSTSQSGAAGSGLCIGYWDPNPVAGNMANVAIWNIDFNGQHFYKGEPSGNTNAAWEDTVGAWDLTISKTTGAPDPSVRYVPTGTILIQVT